MAAARYMGETLPSNQPGGGNVILDEAVTQTDRQRAVSAGRVKSIRGGKDDADLVTGGLDCYRVTSFFIGTCGPGRKPILYFFWTMEILLRKILTLSFTPTSLSQV